VDESLRLQAQTARIELQAGALRGAQLLERLLAVPPRERDAWVDELLGLEAPPPDLEDLPHGAVPYLPCGVDEILTMVRELPLRASDELVDLGSGLGKVVMLAHLLGGARASGVEIQAPLVQSARKRCVELGLDGISFVHANVADLKLDGSVFFLYAPFNGELLNAVLARLEEVARRRAIAVCAVGLELHGVPWLGARTTSNLALTLYESRPPRP
jgi:Methyltransferase domain